MSQHHHSLQTQPHFTCSRYSSPITQPLLTTSHDPHACSMFLKDMNSRAASRGGAFAIQSHLWWRKRWKAKASLVASGPVEPEPQPIHQRPAPVQTGARRWVRYMALSKALRGVVMDGDGPVNGKTEELLRSEFAPFWKGRGGWVCGAIYNPCDLIAVKSSVTRSLTIQPLIIIFSLITAVRRGPQPHLSW